MLLHKRARLAAMIALAGCLTACGSTSSSPDTASRAHTASPKPLSKRTPSPRQSAQHPAVGATQQVHTSGTTLSVTVSRIIDPLVGSGAALLTGTRAIGVFLRIRNDGPGIYDSSATGDISIVPSSGTTTPVFASRGTCQTPLRDFDNYITAGEVRSGCVAFALGTEAKLTAIRFSPHGRPADRAIWGGSS